MKDPVIQAFQANPGNADDCLHTDKSGVFVPYNPIVESKRVPDKEEVNDAFRLVWRALPGINFKKTRNDLTPYLLATWLVSPRTWDVSVPFCNNRVGQLQLTAEQLSIPVKYDETTAVLKKPGGGTPDPNQVRALHGTSLGTVFARWNEYEQTGVTVTSNEFATVTITGNKSPTKVTWDPMQTSLADQNDSNVSQFSGPGLATLERRQPYEVWAIPRQFLEPETKDTPPMPVTFFTPNGRRALNQFPFYNIVASELNLQEYVLHLLIDAHVTYLETLGENVQGGDAFANIQQAKELAVAEYNLRPVPSSDRETRIFPRGRVGNNAIKDSDNTAAVATVITKLCKTEPSLLKTESVCNCAESVFAQPLGAGTSAYTRYFALVGSQYDTKENPFTPKCLPYCNTDPNAVPVRTGVSYMHFTSEECKGDVCVNIVDIGNSNIGKVDITGGCTMIKNHTSGDSK